MAERKITAIAATGSMLYALCDDGTMWERYTRCVSVVIDGEPRWYESPWRHVTDGPLTDDEIKAQFAAAAAPASLLESSHGE